MRRGGTRDGFTLVEVLAALVVLAVSLAAVQEGVSRAARGVRAAGDLLAAERVARAVLAAPVDPARPQVEGERDGLSYRLTLEPLPFAPARVGGEAAAWAPLRVRVRVAMPAGRSLDVETVRVLAVAP